MKKYLTMVVAGLVFSVMISSCATYGGCPSYGMNNQITKHGYKAQAKYTKRHSSKKHI